MAQLAPVVRRRVKALSPPVMKRQFRNLSGALRMFLKGPQGQQYYWRTLAVVFSVIFGNNKAPSMIQLAPAIWSANQTVCPKNFFVKGWLASPKRKLAQDLTKWSNICTEIAIASWQPGLLSLGIPFFPSRMGLLIAFLVWITNKALEKGQCLCQKFYQRLWFWLLLEIWWHWTSCCIQASKKKKKEYMCWLWIALQNCYHKLQANNSCILLGCCWWLAIQK